MSSEYAVFLHKFAIENKNSIEEKKRKTHAEYMREYRKSHPEYNKKQKQSFKKFLENHPNYFYEYNKKWTKEHPEKILQRLRRYRQRHPEKRAEQRLRYTKRHPERKSARRKALRLKPNQCAFCGSKENIERHHPDYSKPLSIVPLCHNCHVKEHQNSEA